MSRIKFREKHYDLSNLEFYTSHLLNDKLLSNRAFNRQMKEAISFLEDDGHSPRKKYTIGVHISPNGGRLTLRSFIGDSCKFINSNNLFRQVVISLDENDNMEVLKTTGAFIESEDYTGFNEEELKDSQVACICKYVYGYYLPNGIETFEAMYSDVFPADCDLNDNQELQRITVFHTPSYWKENDLPEIENPGINTRRNICFRKENQLGILHYYELIDEDQDEMKEIYSADEDALNGSIYRNKLIAIKTKNPNGYMIFENHEVGETLEDICASINKDYLDNFKYLSNNSDDIEQTPSLTVLK